MRGDLGRIRRIRLALQNTYPQRHAAEVAYGYNPTVAPAAPAARKPQGPLAARIISSSSERTAAAHGVGLQGGGQAALAGDQSHLLNFPVDMIKVDRSFVAQMATGRGEIVIKALLDMATGLGMRVVAEGVETPEQAIRLQHLGCVHAQGYLFGRDREQTAEAFLRRPRKVSA